mmetsp:Transcript_39910/g.71744  ORF Transcript_39910/g.71744 Transcript_39910/m.71744 type:complete len:476 (+) Transcript_39910:63-1490(+)
MWCVLHLALVWLSVHHAVRIEVQTGALQPGMSLDEFRLVERLGSWPLGLSGVRPKEHGPAGLLSRHTEKRSSERQGNKSISTGFLQQMETRAWLPDESAAEGVKVDFDEESLERLASGAFGEAWKATTLNPADFQGHSTVVLKLFYMKRKLQDGSEERVYPSFASVKNAKPDTPEAAKAAKRAVKNMRQESKACADTQVLIKRAIATGHPAQPHICECIEDRIFGQYEDKTAYLVQEYCGEPLSSLKGTSRSPEIVLSQAREVLRQLLSVLDLLGTPYPVKILMHHDLKPDNVAYKLENDSIAIKVIDWGGLVSHPRERGDSCIKTYSWAPPESNSKGSDCYAGDCPTSYDIYAAGLIYAHTLLRGWTGWKPRGGILAMDGVDGRMHESMKAWGSNSRASGFNLKLPDKDVDLVFKLCNQDPCGRPSAKVALGILENVAFDDVAQDESSSANSDDDSSSSSSSAESFPSSSNSDA